MDELIRLAMRHERTFAKWSLQLTKDFARQRRTNKIFGVCIASLAALFVYEDVNLFATDQRVKELEKQLAAERAKDVEPEEGETKSEE